MNQELANELIDIIKDYKKLSDFIENEVPYKYSEDIRDDLFLNTYLNDVITRIKETQNV
ncbi:MULTISPECIES: hypothetical protein [Paenibacillus]|uniref:hypothetical protein n=1 Tax=Paenibacillus TaxID=44249 RepID=UPI00142D7D59|nr:hypothetical protein [Paenibacillus xylanexedens]